MGWKHTAYHIINSDPGHTRSKQQLEKNFENNFCQSVQEKEKKEKKLEWQLQSFLRFTQTQKTRMATAKLFEFHANATTSEQ